MNVHNFLKNISFFSLFLILPFIVGDFNTVILITAFIWSIVALSWNLLLGFSNIWAFGNLVFFAGGGYTAAYLSLKAAFSPLIGLFIGGMVGALLGLLVGVPVLRLKMIYVALFTFSTQLFIQSIFLLPEMSPYTGGPIGLQFLPQFTVPGINFVILNYYIGLILFITTIIAIWIFQNSKVGKGLRAIAGSEEAAQTIGINIYKYKVIAFTFSGFFTGVAGAYYAYFFGSITVTVLSFDLLVSIIFMIVVGGMNSFLGPILGVFTITFLNEYMRSSIPGLLSNFRIIILGIAIIVILLAYPTGLAGLIEEIANRIRKKLYRI